MPKLISNSKEIVYVNKNLRAVLNTSGSNWGWIPTLKKIFNNPKESFYLFGWRNITLSYNRFKD